jgi:hypothetical protein
MRSDPWVAQCPLFEHLRIAVYGGKRSAQFVAGVGDEAALAVERFFEASQGYFEMSEHVVDGRGEISDLVFRLRDRQPLREVPCPDAVSGRHYRTYGGERSAGEQIRPDHRQEERHGDTGSEH